MAPDTAFQLKLTFPAPVGDESDVDTIVGAAQALPAGDVLVGVAVGVRVAVDVGVFVEAGVCVGVLVGVGVEVEAGGGVEVGVDVDAGVFVGVGVGSEDELPPVDVIRSATQSKLKSRLVLDETLITRTRKFALDSSLEVQVRPHVSFVAPRM